MAEAEVDFRAIAASQAAGAPVQELSRPQILKLIQTLQELRERGFKEDRRYKVLLKILKSQDLAKYAPEIALSLGQQQTGRTTAQAQSLHQSSSAPSASALQNAVARQTAMAHATTLPGGRPPAGAVAPAAAAAAAAAKAAVISSGEKVPFTPTQLTQLRAQILAYKHISRNKPLPPDLINVIRQISEARGIPVTAIAQPRQTSVMGTPAFSSRTATMGHSTFPTSSSNASSHSSAASSSSSSVTSQTQSVMDTVNPDIPQALDPAFLSGEREKILASKLRTRLDEIKDLRARELPEEQVVKLKIEEAQIKLLQKQRQVRQQVAMELKRAAANAAATEKSGYRRSRKVHSRLTEAEKYTQEQKRRKKQKHQEFLAHVTDSARKFKEFHSSHLQKTKRLNRSVVTFHASKLRREQQQAEREEKERMRALKEHDEVAYMKLLEKTKNDRLTQLLQQTDDYLNQIGAKLQQAKEAAGPTGAGAGPRKDLTLMTDEEKKRLLQREAEEAKQLESTKNYYTIAHTIQEEVTEQPSILVGGTLKPYQMLGLQWLVSLYNNSLNGVLADEMGLGKTIQTIALITYLMETKGNNGPYLIVVPLSTIHNWDQELEAWAPSVGTVVYKGSPTVRKGLYRDLIAPGKFNVLLTTYDFVLRDKKYLSQVSWAYVIVDEGHRMKNSQCKLTLTLSKHFKSRYRVLLTGTPLQNSLPELWSLLNFLLPSIFNSVANFEQWFAAPFAAAGEQAEMSEEERLLIIYRLHKVLRPFLLRRVKSEVEDQLPEKVEKVLRCDFSAMQTRLYEAMSKKGLLLVDPDSNAKKINSRGLRNTLMQLRKVCNHPYLFVPNLDYAVDENLVRASGKFALLDNILPKLKAKGHRVLIFSQMTSLLTVMEDYFSYRQFKYMRLDGATKPDDRASLVNTFNADHSYFVFMLSTRAGGLGLNLQTADTVIIFDSDWNPQIDLQAQDRAHRIGQKKAVLVLRLISIDSIEERILSKAKRKLDVDKMIIQAGKFNNTSSQSERREFLRSLLANQGANHTEAVPTNKQLNAMIGRSEEEIEFFNAWDKERTRKGEEGGATMAEPLMQDDELPAWITADVGNDAEEDDVVYGRGQRERADVCYDDGLSDFRFEKMLEEGKDPGPRKRGKKRTASEMDGDEELDIDDESSTATEAARGPLAGKVLATAVDTPTKKQRGRGRKKRRLLSDAEQERLEGQVREVITAMRAAREGDRILSGVFEKLPTKRELPSYYALIKQPVDIQGIEKKLSKGLYASLLMVKDDISLMFRNAMTFNIEGSLIYADAVTLLSIAMSKFAELEAAVKARPTVEAPPLMALPFEGMDTTMN